VTLAFGRKAEAAAAVMKELEQRDVKVRRFVRWILKTQLVATGCPAASDADRCTGFAASTLESACCGSAVNASVVCQARLLV
jgi:hypothetical protein